MNIDIVKASEIIFNSLLQAVISAAIIYITFRLGQWQSDRNWKREVEQREKEREKTEKIEKTIRKINALHDAIDLHYQVWLRMTENKGLQTDEFSKAQSLLSRTCAVFQGPDEIATYEALDKLSDATFWRDYFGPDLSVREPNPRERSDFLLEISKVLNERLLN